MIAPCERSRDAVLLVELAEGPRMISRLIDADHATADLDPDVEFICVPVDERTTSGPPAEP